MTGLVRLPFFATAAVMIAAASPTAALAQAPDAARVPVQQLSDGLIAIMKGGAKLGVAGRAAQIGPVVDRTFDLALMARLCVGPAWTAATPADRAAVVAAFRRLTVNEYAKNFDSWSGQSFTIDPKVEVRGGDKVVRTTLVQPKGESVALAYRLRQTGNSWRVIDVFYRNAVSQLTTRRADFESIVAKGGAKALIGHINALADKAAR